MPCPGPVNVLIVEPSCARTAPAGVCPRCVLGLGFGSPPAGERDSWFETKSAEPNEGAAGAGLLATPPPTAPRDSFVPPGPDELARHFPQLEILELLGQGGMGAVYKARQRRLDRLVALKILPPAIARNPGFEERFVREARALARLNHPHIVTLHDFGEAGGLYYFLMEYVDGVNLRQMIGGGGLGAREALAIVPQVCEALQYAHDEGIVHRDIKPENLLVDRKGRVKIADFGLVKLVNKGDERGGRAAFVLTGSQQVMGTPHYMAPEQMEQPQGVDHRADIYSLGVVFYEMLTGELPLGRFAPPSRMVEIDVRIDEVVLRSLEKKPEQRYQHASDVKTDVENIVQADHGPYSGKNSLRNGWDELDSVEPRSSFVRVLQSYSTLIAAGCLIVALLVVLAWRITAISPPARPAVSSPPAKAFFMPRPSPGWNLQPNGPVLTDDFAQGVLRLEPSRADRVNAILQTIYREFLAVEAKNTDRDKDDAGHVVVKINPFPGATAKLENRLWSELDAILDTREQSLARWNLQLDAPKLQGKRPIANADLAGPGFFGWGKDGARIDLWRVGSWYHWRVHSRGIEDSGSAPQLPENYRRFWTESPVDGD